MLVTSREAVFTVIVIDAVFKCHLKNPSVDCERLTAVVRVGMRIFMLVLPRYSVPSQTLVDTFTPDKANS